MWVMITIYEYYSFTGDDTFLQTNWPNYKAAMNYLMTLLQPNGLLQMKGLSDWARYVYSTNGSEPQML